MKWKRKMDLKKVIKTVPDFPVKGIMYKDVTSILENPKAFQYTVTKITDYRLINSNLNIILLKNMKKFICQKIRYTYICPVLTEKHKN